ncbi:MAG TPA: heme ABC exporter ATP-binding protein CcmA [Myxococcaceae bacterium]|nr:heme ABC exporter ATP-binding protein CcmA [Myxococcaceae bacterium]
MIAGAPSLSSDVSSLAVEVRDVSKRFGRRWALARISYQLPAGRSLLLTGHNGSGKTTLLKVIATSLRPTAGSLRVLGLDALEQREEIRSQVGLLAHASFLYEDLSAEQNLVVLARLLGVHSPKEAAGALLTRVGLGKRSDHPIRHFSAGMRKRLAIARLLLKAPRIALLDEPFGELDPAGIDQMERIIADLKRSGTALILATHLVEQGLALCESRLHLQEGRAIAA